MQERLKVLRDERRDDEADALNEVLKDKVNITIHYSRNN